MPDTENTGAFLPLEQERELIRQLWAEGVASGPGQLKDMVAIKAEARKRLFGAGDGTGPARL